MIKKKWNKKKYKLWFLDNNKKNIFEEKCLLVFYLWIKSCFEFERSLKLDFIFNNYLEKNSFVLLFWLWYSWICSSYLWNLIAFIPLFEFNKFILLLFVFLFDLINKELILFFPNDEEEYTIL